MRRDHLRPPLRALAGLALALALWRLVAPALHQSLIAAASALLGSGIALLPDGNALLIGPSDLPRARAAVPMAILSSNLVLFGALWSWDRGAFRPRNIGRFLVGVAILVVLQIGALVAAVHATLAVTLAEATGERYSAWEANGWFLLWQGYQVVGAWAAAFMVWWGLRRAGEGG